MRILVTGAAGRLGRKLTLELEANHDLILSDLNRLEDPRYIPLDVRDRDAVRAAVQGCDAVVHMAMLDWPPCSTVEALRYVVPAFQVHAIGLSNVLQAAWEAGTRRVVYTSSVSAVDGIPPGTQIGSDTRHYSNAVYGLTKGFGEDLCHMFHHSLGLSVMVLRLGTIFLPESGGAWIGNVYVPDLVAHPAPEPASSRVHVDDVTRAIEFALTTSETEYALVHIVGTDSGNRWDLETARRVLGWEARYTFEADGLPRAF